MNIPGGKEEKGCIEESGEEGVSRVFPSAPGLGITALDLGITAGAGSLCQAVLCPQPPARRNRPPEPRGGEGPFHAVPEPDSRTARLSQLGRPQREPTPGASTTGASFSQFWGPEVPDQGAVRAGPRGTSLPGLWMTLLAVCSQGSSELSESQPWCLFLFL